MSRVGTFSFAVVVAGLIQGCGSRVPEPSHPNKADIEAAERLFGHRLSSDGEIDWTNEEVQNEVRFLLRSYAQYANDHRGDSLTSVYMMKRADLLHGRGDHEAAIAQWLDVVEGFPKEDIAAEAIFRMGFVRETAMQDTVGALKAYAELVRLFPESPWTAQAEMSAQWLTFSEEKFIEALSEGR